MYKYTRVHTYVHAHKWFTHTYIQARVNMKVRNGTRWHHRIILGISESPSSLKDSYEFTHAYICTHAYIYTHTYIRKNTYVHTTHSHIRTYKHAATCLSNETSIALLHVVCTLCVKGTCLSTAPLLITCVIHHRVLQTISILVYVVLWHSLVLGTSTGESNASCWPKGTSVLGLELLVYETLS